MEMEAHCSEVSPTRSACERYLGVLRYAAMHDESDGDLARRIASGAGDVRSAEGELCRRFAPRVRLYGLRHLRTEDRARDLVQSVLLAVLEALRAGRVEDPDRIDRFVLGTCRNAALRRRANDTRAEPRPHDELDVVAVIPPAPETVEVRALVRCLAALDLRGRTVVQMTYVDERSTEEIAAALETTPGNVRVARHRAIAQLRRCVDERRGVRA